MAPPRDIVADMGVQGARDLVVYAETNKSVDAQNGMGCRLYTGSLQTDGYGQISGRATRTDNKERSYSLHRLVAVANTGANVPAGHHASHLCDIRRCFRRGHIHVETILANNSRKNCIGSIICRDHGHVLWACAHQPACIRVPTTVQTCCLKINEAQKAANTTDVGQQMSQGFVDDFTAAALAAHTQPDPDAAVRTYAEVVRSRSVSRQPSVQPSSQQGSRAGSSRAPAPAYSSSLTPAQREAHERTGFDPGAW